MYRSGLYHDPGKKRRRCEKGPKPCEKITAKKQIRYFFRGDIIEKVWLSCHQGMEKLCDRVPSARQETTVYNVYIGDRLWAWPSNE